MFDQSYISYTRKSLDKSVNNYGYKLIDFLKTNNLFILNGRTPGDNIEKPTCRNASTVDYFVCSPSLFDSVIELCVDDFCCMYSDVHCPVYVTFNFNCYTLYYL